MSDAAITVVAIILGVVLMFIFPLITMADKKDDVETMKVQNAVTDFVNKSRVKGEISREDWDEFVLTLNNTSEYAFAPEVIVEKKDEDYAKKATKDEYAATIGDNVYLVEYHTQIMDALNQSGSYKLNEGDILTVNVKNINRTISTQLRNIWFSVTGKDTGNITASASGMVSTTGQ